MNSAIHLLFFIFTFHSLQSNQLPTVDNNNCKTPDGKFGSCLKISKCPSIRTYISENKDTMLIQDQHKFLKNYTCGKIEGLPKVCCPNKKIVNLQNNYIQPNSLYPTSNDIFHKNLKLLPRNCGRNDMKNKITFKMREALNSSKTNINEFPWMVLLFSSRVKAFVCVGTIINENYILTSAFCTKKKLHFVRVGAHNILSKNCKLDENNIKECFLPSQDIKIRKQILHKKFSESSARNDIALLELSEPLNISSENVRAVCLPLQNSPKTIIALDTHFILTGWGLTKKKKMKDTDLLKSEVCTIPQEECNQAYINTNYDLMISNERFCYYGRNAKSDPCNSDTGSPLLKLHGTQYTQYGIVSIGPRKCRAKGIPTIVTRIDQYINWILDNMGP